MADKLNVYKGSELIASAERDAEGTATVSIDNLDANTDYAEGTYKVAFENENGESGKVNVPAFKTKPINVTGVTLDKSTLSLEEGTTGNLVSTVAPSTASDKTVTFASSDAEVATVDNTGKVTAVAEGSAEITVTTKDGSKTAKCTLTVTAESIAVTDVTLDKSTLSLEVGATGNLVSTVAPSTASDKTVTFASSDAEVATVDNTGKVTAVAEGSAEITVTTKDGSKTAKCTLTVTAESIAVTDVTLDKSTLSLEVGATGNLVSTVAPSTASDKTVTFASSDAEVATVDNTGKVTAVAEGSAEITVTTKDGSKTAKCTLTVTAESIAVTDVTLDKSTLSLEVGATGKLVATVEPSTATNKSVSYKSLDDAIATVSSNGTVTGVKAGTADITVTTQDGKKSDVATVTVKPIEVTGVTLDKSTLSLDVGATATLNATVAPSNATYKAVGFTSSDDAIATVDNDGLVTAVAPGSAEITVESISDGSKTATSTVTVAEDTPTDPENVGVEPNEDNADVSAE